MGFGRYQPTRTTEHMRSRVYLAGNGALAAPDSISGLKLWLSAQKAANINAGSPADGDLVALWKDATANHVDFSQSTDLSKPTYHSDLFNGKPGLRFFGNTLVNNAGALLGDGTQPFTVFAIAAYDGDYAGGFSYIGTFTVDGGNNDIGWGFSNISGYQNLAFGGPPGTSGKIPGVRAANWPTSAAAQGLFFPIVTYDGSGTVAGVNIYNKNSSSLGVTAAADDTLGSRPNIIGSWSAASQSLHGAVYEYLIYNKVLSSAEISQLVAYFLNVYYARNGALTPVIGPGGGSLATSLTPVLTNPRVSQTSISNDASEPLLVGTHLYIPYYQEANSAPRLECWDVSNRSAPTLSSSVAAPVNPGHAAFSITKGNGNIAYVPLYKGSAIAVVDISNPAAVTQINEFTTMAGPQYCCAWGNYLIVPGTSNGTSNLWELWHVANPLKPSRIFTGRLTSGSLSTAPVVSNDGYIYIVAGGSGAGQLPMITVWNANDLSNITQVGTYTFPDNFDTGSVYINIVGNRLYTSNHIENTVYVFDISTRSSPALLYSFTPTGSAPIQVEVVGNYAYVLCQTGNCIDVWNISSNSAGSHYGTINTSANQPDGMYIDATNGYIYVVLGHPTGVEGIDSPNYLEIYKII